jgi:hypothetical protein
MQELFKDLMSQQRFAAIGATDNPQKYGNQIMKNPEGKEVSVGTYFVNDKLKLRT